MHLFRQLAIIIGCLAVGELVVWLTHIPIPSSILGLLLLTALLQTKAVKEEWINDVSSFLTSNMAFFFVPPGVALVLYLNVIKAELLPIVVSVIVSTILVMVFTGWSHRLTQKFIARIKPKKEEGEQK